MNDIQVIKELAYRNEQLKLEMSATVATNKTLNELLRDLDTKIKKAVDCGKAILNANSKVRISITSKSILNQALFFSGRPNS